MKVSRNTLRILKRNQLSQLIRRHQSQNSDKHCLNRLRREIDELAKEN